MQQQLSVCKHVQHSTAAQHSTGKLHQTRSCHVLAVASPSGENATSSFDSNLDVGLSPCSPVCRQLSAWQAALDVIGPPTTTLLGQRAVSAIALPHARISITCFEIEVGLVHESGGAAPACDVASVPCNFDAKQIPGPSFMDDAPDSFCRP
jgi:hypothetical protein